MSAEYFPKISKIKFEGRASENPLAFKFYDENKVIGNKKMKEHLRFAVAYWHSFCNKNSDPFGEGTRVFPWEVNGNPMQTAINKLDAAFEFMQKIGIGYYCFHDRDIAPEGNSIFETESNLRTLIDIAKKKQSETGIKLIWGTADLFSHRRYMNGAASNPEFGILCRAAAQVKSAIDATIELGGENYVFWGGREGYSYLFNTDMKRELEHLGMFFKMARDYGRSRGFKGVFMIEPKPMEPSTHQYDFDAATVIGFLERFGLQNDFKLNIESNHATLAGHSFAHELQTASDSGLLGSLDINRGISQNGWDTDNFPTDIYDAVQAMIVILSQGGIAPGCLNFDAKLRRNSTDPEDIFIAHIAGMDTYARGLEIAYNILNETEFKDLKRKRYSSYDSGKGLDFEKGSLKLEDLANIARENKEPALISGKQEYLESIINKYI